MYPANYIKFVKAIESRPGEIIVGQQYEEIAVCCLHLDHIVNDFKKQVFYKGVNEGTGDEGKVVEKNSRLLHAAIGMLGESCELFNRVYADIGEGGEDELDPDLANWLEELGDVGWYAVVAMDACGFTHEQVVQANWDMLALRNPGGKFNPDNAETRDTEAERAVLESHVSGT